MKEITLTKGKVAMVDDEDFVYLSKYKWYAISTAHSVYAARRTSVNGKSKHILMHRVIMNCKDKSTDIDHIDHNGLNNQRQNLRLCSRSENCMNSRKRSSKSSIYKGVVWASKECRWRSQITVDGGKRIDRFHVRELDAAISYDEEAKKHFGQFAHGNFF